MGEDEALPTLEELGDGEREIVGETEGVFEGVLLAEFEIVGVLEGVCEEEGLTSET